MKKSLALAAAVMLPLGVLAVPSAALAAGCTNSSAINMRFADMSPFRSGYSSTSPVIGYAFSAYTYSMNGRCTSAAGLLWYRAAGSPPMYIYSAHRIN
ncbi:hypothetical protein ACIBEF_31405 [Micromonospora sp. NPDC050795]|uniref:hypothetical protein n=1 Tax=Micromonospora sp. NPDC050795 TaxID=3364282 RepID=UPI00379CE75D